MPYEDRDNKGGLLDYAQQNPLNQRVYGTQKAIRERHAYRPGGLFNRPEQPVETDQRFFTNPMPRRNQGLHGQQQQRDRQTSIFDAYAKYKSGGKSSPMQTAMWKRFEANPKFQAAVQGRLKQGGFKSFEDYSRSRYEGGLMRQGENELEPGSPEGMGGLGSGLGAQAETPELSQADKDAIGGFVGKASKMGWGPIAQELLSNPVMAASLVGAGVGFTTAMASGRPEDMVKATTTGAIKGAINSVTSKLGIGLGLAASFTANVMEGLNAGKNPGMAVADAAANTGLNISGAVIGSMLGGPFGMFVGATIAASMATKNLVSQGFIGDWLDIREDEAFRDAFEDLDISKEQKEELGRMANASVNPGSQLNAIERALGYQQQADLMGLSRGYGTAGGYGGLGGLGAGMGIGQEGMNDPDVEAGAEEAGETASEAGGRGGV